MPLSDGPISPPWLFGRQAEWGRLLSFVTEAGTGNRLAIVYGRRRQGKSTLLQEIAVVTGSFYWEAAEQSASQNLDSFSTAWSSYTRSDGPIRFRTWEEAFEIVLKPAPDGASNGVFLDEVGYLVNSSPEFPSLLQRHFGPRSEREGTARVILCGSIYAQMTRLLAAGKPLRGRHRLIVDVAPFTFRQAAEFWGLSDNPEAAFRLHALIGGTPAYLRFSGDAKPSKGNVDRWTIEHLLDPSSPLYHEGQILVSEDPTLVDKALYWSVLSAVADGNRRRNDIARTLGRSAGALAQPLAVLSAGRWIEMVPDPFHRGSTSVLLTEPIVRSHRVLIAPESQRLSRSLGRLVWEDSQHRVSRLIHAPHLEWMANEWTLTYASPSTLGSSIRASGPGILRQGGEVHQLDVVATTPDRNDVDRICAIGEVKAEREAMGITELVRLDDIARKLGPRAATSVRKLLFSRSGFTSEFRRLVRTRNDVELIDLDRLYNGS